MANESEIVLFDSPGAVTAILSQYSTCRPEILFVAATAEALDAASVAGITAVPICELVPCPRLDSTELLALLGRWHKTLRSVDNHLSATLKLVNPSGPGILESRSYQIATALSSICYRYSLNMAAFAALKIPNITIMECEPDKRLFGGCGYSTNPWTHMTVEMMRTTGRTVRVRNVRRDEDEGDVSAKTSLRFVPTTVALAKNIVREVRTIASDLQIRSTLQRSKALRGLRVLFSDASGYDSELLCEELHKRGASVFLIDSAAWVANSDEATYRTRLRTLGRFRRQLSANSVSGSDSQLALKNAFDAYRMDESKRRALAFRGCDLWGPLRQYLRTLVVKGGSLHRHTSSIIDLALNETSPRIVVFSSMTRAFEKQMCHECNVRGIPVVCYQHGGSYGTHDIPTHEFIENAFADTFLTYGIGVHPPKTRTLRTRAEYVPVGSARLESWITKNVRARKRTAGETMEVLVVGDISLKNALHTGAETEDTYRFRVERETLRVLSKSGNLRVRYRPFPYDHAGQATPAWLQRQQFANTVIDRNKHIRSSLKQADLAIVLSSSGTVTNEALTLGVPIIAYQDTNYVHTYGTFLEDLRNATTLCESREALETALNDLTREGRNYLLRFKEKAVNKFIREYVLHERQCTERALSVLTDTANWGS